MKKICFVAEYMYCGGVEKSLLSLLPFLDRKKYKITLLLLQKKGDFMSQLPPDIEVVEIPLPEDERDELLFGRGAALKKALKERRFIKAIGKALRATRMVFSKKSGCARRLWFYNNISSKIKPYPEQFDVVIDYMGYGLFNTFYAAKKVRGKTKLSWVHFEPSFAIPDFDAFETLLQEFNHIMCVSEESRRQVQELMPCLSGRLEIFYNIINRQELLEKAQDEHIEKKAKQTTILSIGRLDPPKGFDLGIRAVEQLLNEGYSIKYNIIGDGWQYRQLKEQISQNEATKQSVVLMGQKLNPYPYLDSCDIYFQPSRHEGYGIALAEARALCKPIVSTDFAGAKEQLKHGETGLIIPCTVDEMVRALKTLLDNPDMRKTFSHNLHKQTEQPLAQVQRLTTIFDET